MFNDEDKNCCKIKQNHVVLPSKFPSQLIFTFVYFDPSIYQ